jgi:signal transduction histidine kinase/DNA-binding response OmpR family regulator
MKAFIVIFLLLFSALLDPLLGQDVAIDSLKNQALSIDDDFVKAKVYNQLAWEYRDSRPDSSLFFSNQAIKLAQKNNYSRQEIQALNYMGVAYRNLSVYSKAFEMYIEALKLAEDRGDNEQRGYTLINIGNLYLFQTNFQGAITYFIQALDQAQSLGNRRMQGYCYINLGRSYEGKQEFGQAELYYKQVIELRENLDDEYGILAAEIELAEVYRKQNKLNFARDLVYQIINKTNEDDSPRVLILAYNTLSKILAHEGKTTLAEEYAKRSLELSKKVTSRYDEKETLKNISEIYAQRGNYKVAYENHINYSELNQQLFSEESIRKIEQLKNKYEIEQQEAENEFLRKQTELNAEVIRRQQIIILLTILAIVIVAIAAILIYRAYLIRKRLNAEISSQKDKIEADKNVIESQSKKLIELDKAKSRFFANVSHDLRSPLSLILGNLDMLKEDEENFLSPAGKKNLEVSLKNSKRLLYLTDEINDITRLEEGKIRLKTELVAINGYLKMLLEMFKSTAEFKGVRMQYVSKLPDHYSFKIDPRQFEKIYYNLVSNALRYTKKGDRITVESVEDHDEVIIKFIDTGEGISKDHQPYIFDRFYQSSDQEYKAQEGMGIGLALVKDLVQLHNGFIDLESEEGIGTTFNVRVPLVKKGDTIQIEASEYIADQQEINRDLELNQSSRVSLDLDLGGAVDKPKLLLVDDHPEIRYYIRQILENDYLVFEAAHGLEALDLLKKESIDIIITDLMMPWMDGFELIEAINSNEQLKRIPLLVVSARISGDDKEKVLYQGVNDYLQKPFAKKELVLRIENLIKQKDKYADETKNVFQSLIKNNLVDVEQDIKQKLESIVKEKISDPNLSVFTLSDSMAASERQVYRLVKKLTGLTPLEYITEIRLQFADYLIRQRKVGNATEAAKAIGIKNVTTFNRLYQKKFNVKPTELFSD